MSPKIRSLIVLIVGGIALAFAADAVIHGPDFRLPKDFPEYWAAGRVNLRGGNPYHPDELFVEQKRADENRTDVVMMWNPPPALAVYMPLGAIGPRWAALLWVGLQLAAVVVACDLLWRAFYPSNQVAAGEQAPHRGFATAVALTFVGTWWLVAFGQNTGFMLLGLAGFLHLTKKEKPLAAGACAALTALKPHLLAVFGALLVADALTRRGRTTLAAGSAMIAVALGVALAANPEIIAQFVEATRHPAEGAIPLSGWKLPVPAYVLRMNFAPTHFWVQFVPCAVACAIFLAYRIRCGTAWDWRRALPLVVAVSVLATPYGGWIFDLPVLLVPVVWATARLVSAKKRALAGALVAGQAVITVASFTWVFGLHEFWWVAPAALALCLPALFVRANFPDKPYPETGTPV